MHRLCFFFPKKCLSPAGSGTMRPPAACSRLDLQRFFAFVRSLPVCMGGLASSGAHRPGSNGSEAPHAPPHKPGGPRYVPRFLHDTRAGGRPACLPPPVVPLPLLSLPLPSWDANFPPVFSLFRGFFEFLPASMVAFVTAKCFAPPDPLYILHLSS